MEFSRQDNISVLEWAMKSTLVKVFDGILISAFPFLGMPAVKQLMDLVLGDIIGRVVKDADMGVFYAYTDLRVSAQGRDFIKAAEEHQRILKGGTDAEKQKSEDELFLKFRSLARLNA